MIERPKMTFAGGKLLIRSPCIDFELDLGVISGILVKARTNTMFINCTQLTKLNRVFQMPLESNFREDGLTSLMESDG